jgi:hypothetical protein
MGQSNLVVEVETEIAEASGEVTMLELLAIQAMMNPNSEESSEDLFDWDGKFDSP